MHGISQAIVEQVQPTDFVSRRCVHGRLPPRTPSGFPSVIYIQPASPASCLVGVKAPLGWRGGVALDTGFGVDTWTGML